MNQEDRLAQIEMLLGLSTPRGPVVPDHAECAVCYPSDGCGENCTNGCNDVEEPVLDLNRSLQEAAVGAATTDALLAALETLAFLAGDEAISSELRILASDTILNFVLSVGQPE